MLTPEQINSLSEALADSQRLNRELDILQAENENLKNLVAALEVKQATDREELLCAVKSEREELTRFFREAFGLLETQIDDKIDGLELQLKKLKGGDPV